MIAHYCCQTPPQPFPARLNGRATGFRTCASRPQRTIAPNRARATPANAVCADELCILVTSQLTARVPLQALRRRVRFQRLETAAATRRDCTAVRETTLHRCLSPRRLAAAASWAGAASLRATLSRPGQRGDQKTEVKTPAQSALLIHGPTLDRPAGGRGYSPSDGSVSGLAGPCGYPCARAPDGRSRGQHDGPSQPRRVAPQHLKCESQPPTMRGNTYGMMNLELGLAMIPIRLDCKVRMRAHVRV